MDSRGRSRRLGYGGRKKGLLLIIVSPRPQMQKMRIVRLSGLP